MNKPIFKRRYWVLTATLLLSCLATAAEYVSIPFANLGNTIRDWQSPDSDVLYVQSSNRDWYRITFWAPCQELPFAEGIAFVTGGGSQLDQFSSIMVGNERCGFRTFEKSDAPPTRAQRKQAQEQEKAAKASAEKAPDQRP